MRLRRFGLVVVMAAEWQTEAQDARGRIRAWPRLINT
jgi:hypothetical protein